MAGRASVLFTRNGSSLMRNTSVLSQTTSLSSSSSSSSSSFLITPSSSQQTSLMRPASTTTTSVSHPTPFPSQERIGREKEVVFAAVGLSLFFAFAEEAEVEEKFTKENSAEVIKQADSLYKAKKMKEAYTLLQNYNKCVGDDVETIWRHSRAAYEYAQTEPEGPHRKELIYQSNAIAKNALETYKNHHQIQKWNGISTSAVTDYEGTTSKIQLSYTIRDHFEAVIRLAPSDPYGYFLLGKWQFTFSEMPWYTRKLAATFFATPPSSTYEEALQSFLKAEEAQPDFYLDNKLMVAKCLVQLGEKEEAREWLERVAKTNAEYFNDHDVIKQAREMLRAL